MAGALWRAAVQWRYNRRAAMRLAALLLCASLLSVAHAAAPAAGDGACAAAAHLEGWRDSNESLPLPCATDSRCIRNQFGRRVCLYTNLVYDTSERKFVYFGSPPDGKVEPDWPQLVDVGVAEGKDMAKGLRIEYVKDAPFKSADEICDERAPTYMHGIFRQSSFGHILRDNFPDILRNLKALHVNYREFKILMVDPGVEFEWSPQRFEKYGRWLAREVGGFFATRNACSQSGRRFLLFRGLVTGFAEIAGESPDCHGDLFQEMRLTAYRLANLDLNPVREHSKFLVVLNDKPRKDNRRLANAPDIERKLRQHFASDKSVVIMKLIVSELSEVAQLELLRSTAIFITTAGSASFRKVYLPPGAQVVLIGPPKSDKFTNPFWEVDSCWNVLNDINITKFWVTQEESQQRFDRDHVLPHEKEMMTWWDSDVLPAPERVVATVTELIEQLRVPKAARRQLIETGRPQAGSLALLDGVGSQMYACD